MFEHVPFDYVYSTVKKVLDSIFTDPDFYPELRVESEFNAQTIVGLYQDIVYGKRECRAPIIILHNETRRHFKPVIIMPALNGGLPSVFFPWMTIENSYLAGLFDDFMTELDHNPKFNLIRPFFTKSLYVSLDSPHPEAFPAEILKTDEHFCLYQLFYLFQRKELLGKTIDSLPLPYDELFPAFEEFDFFLSKKDVLPNKSTAFFSSRVLYNSAPIQQDYFTARRPEKREDIESLKTLSFQQLIPDFLKNAEQLGEYAVLLNQYVQTPSLENLRAIQGGKLHFSMMNENQELARLLMTRFLESLQKAIGLNFLCDFPVPLECFDFYFDIIAKFADKWQTYFNQENYFAFLPLLFSLFSGSILPRSLYLLSLVFEDHPEAWPASVNSATLMTPEIPPAHQEMWVGLIRAMLFQKPILIPPPAFLVSLFHDQLDFELSLRFLPQETQFDLLREIISNAQNHSHNDFVSIIEHTFSEYEIAVGPDKEKLNEIKKFLLSDENLPMPDLHFIRSNRAAHSCVNTWLKGLDNTGIEAIEQKCKMLDIHLFHLFPEAGIETTSGMMNRNTPEREFNVEQEQKDGFASLKKDLLSNQYDFQQALTRFISRLTERQIKVQREITDNGDFNFLEENERLNIILSVCTQDDLATALPNPEQEVLRQKLWQIKEDQEAREFESLGADAITRTYTNSSVVFFNANLTLLSDEEISDHLTQCFAAYTSLNEQGLLDESEENTRFSNLLNQIISLPLLPPKNKRDFYNIYREKIEEMLRFQAAINLSLQTNCT